MEVKTQMRKYKNFLIVNGVFALSAIIFVAVSFILKQSGMDKCAFFEAFHLYCPGCGGTRSFFALLRLDIISAVKYNVAVPIAAILYIYYDIRAFVAIKKGDTEYFKREKYVLIFVAIGILLVNAVVRNVLIFYGIDLIGDLKRIG